MPVTPVRTPIVLFALFASLAVTAAQAPPAIQTPTSDADHPFIVRQQTDRVRYEADGTGVRHVSRDVLIQAPAGLDVWRDLTVHYTVDRERVTLVRLDIVKPSGERVQPPNLSLEDRRQSGLFDQKVFGDLSSAADWAAQFVIPAGTEATQLLAQVDTVLAANTPLAGAAAHPGWQRSPVLPVVESDERLLGVLTSDALARALRRAARGGRAARPESVGGVLAQGYWETLSSLVQAAATLLPRVPPVGRDHER